MNFVEKYGTFQKARLFSIIIDNNEEAFNEEFPDLLPYKDNLYSILYFAKRCFDINNAYVAASVVDSAFYYIEVAKDNKFEITEEYLLINKVPDIKGFFYFLWKYIVLEYPDIMINHSIDEYVINFNKVLDTLFASNYTRDCFKNNERLYNLMSIVEVLKKRFNYAYLTKKQQMPSLIAFVTAYCYKNNNGYDLVINCAKDFKKFIEIMVLRGYMAYYESLNYTWTMHGTERAFPVVSDIFSKNKKIIK